VCQNTEKGGKRGSGTGVGANYWEKGAGRKEDRKRLKLDSMKSKREVELIDGKEGGGSVEPKKTKIEVLWYQNGGVER